MRVAFRPYRIPIAVTGMMIVAVAFWAWQRWRDIRDHEQDMQRHFAMGISESIEGALRDLVRNGRLPHDQAQRLLESIIRHSPVRFVILEQDGRRILQVGEASDDLALSGDEGQTVVADHFVYWRKARIQGDRRNEQVNNHAGSAGEKSEITDLVLDDRDQMLILGLENPLERRMGPKPPNQEDLSPGNRQRLLPPFRESHGAPPLVGPEDVPPPDRKGGPPPDWGGGSPPGRAGIPSPLMDMYVTVFAALLFITASLLAWIMAIRSRLLAEQLKGERSRHAHLEELGLAAAGLAHETKNPLGIISGIAQQIIADPNEPKQSRAMLEHVLDEVDKATARLGNFMAFARQREAKVTSVNARQACLKVATILRPDFDADGVKLEVDCPAGGILADEEMLRQIVVNLLLNSLHASSAGKNIVVRLSRLGAQAVLTVEDQGCGIAPELLPNIFKPYVTGSPSGHGLGLAIVKRFVDEHGWEIHVDSHPGRGTVTTISGIELSGIQEPQE